MITLIEVNRIRRITQIDIKQEGQIKDCWCVIRIHGQGSPVIALCFIKFPGVPGNHAQMIQRLDMFGIHRQRALKPLFRGIGIPFLESNDAEVGHGAGLVRIVAGQLLKTGPGFGKVALLHGLDRFAE